MGLSTRERARIAGRPFPSAPSEDRETVVASRRVRDLVANLRSGPVLVMDGAMGTELMRRGQSCSFPYCELFNQTRPELVRAIHQSYLDAGAEVLLTNTFQAHSAALERNDCPYSLHTIWQSAIQLARCNPKRGHHVLAAIGPMQRVTKKIAAGLLAECVDVSGVLLETWTSAVHLQRFAELAQLPVLISFTFRRGSRLTTHQGASPETCARQAHNANVAALGANCGSEIGLEDLKEIIDRYRSACDLPIFVRPNAGTPTGNARKYPLEPEAMAEGIEALLDAGVRMIGGCCGTTPEHIRAIRRAVDRWERRSRSRRSSGLEKM